MVAVLYELSVSRDFPIFATLNNTTLCCFLKCVIHGQSHDCFYFIYCESTIVFGVPIFMVFEGRPNHEIRFPTMEISFDVYIENLKTTNLRIHELVLLP